MVFDDHQVSYVEIQVGSSGGIGNEEGFDAQLDHDADGKDHLVHSVALVEVDAALHGEDGFSSQLSGDKVALVSHGRGDGETGKGTVRDDNGVFYDIRQAAEAAPEDDSYLRLPAFEVFLQAGGNGIDDL